MIGDRGEVQAPRAHLSQRILGLAGAVGVAGVVMQIDEQNFI
ncbi:MAG TPA: hypothetical protein VFU22_06180 [Roseiflexaceae bacterium]|nr:hypothetical protein [Roseiflexaceae bacterium]